MIFSTRVHLGVVLLCATFFAAHAASLGEFSDHSDVGGPKRAGSAEFDSAKRSFRITGGGKNMWATNDAFHFVWKKISGDVTLTADIAFEGKGVEAHRKACLLIRQSLDTDSAYADAALHGDGSTGLQYRDAKSAITKQVQTTVKAPTRLHIEKHGKTISMSIARAGEALQPIGKIELEFTEPFYVGLGVCAHNDEALETATFANLELTQGVRKD